MGNCMSGKATQADAAAPATGASETNPLQIGNTIPNFACQSTAGDFNLHDWLVADADKPWTILFSHPKDFTPVCTTELGMCHKLAPGFGDLGCKLIGISCDDVESHKAWAKDVEAYSEDTTALRFPIIADNDRKFVTDLGMLDPDERDAAGLPLPARALVILLGTQIKFSIVYPATTGRNFDEIKRCLTSLQLTELHGLTTPANWKAGDRVHVGASVPSEYAEGKFQEFKVEASPSGKEYMRSVNGPALPDAIKGKAITVPKGGSAPAALTNPLKLGAKIPDFQLKTTAGDKGLHAFIEEDKEKPWVILMTHPEDFTSVGTTELAAAHDVAPLFESLKARFIAISGDSVDNHKKWIEDIVAVSSTKGDFKFPIADDSDKSISKKLGLLSGVQPEHSSRTVVFLNGTTVRLTLTYPATTGRDFVELVRVLRSMQATGGQGLASPANWTYGNRLIVAPSVDTETAKGKFKDFKIAELPSGKPYLRSVECPEEFQSAPVLGA